MSIRSAIRQSGQVAPDPADRSTYQRGAVPPTLDHCAPDATGGITTAGPETRAAIVLHAVRLLVKEVGAGNTDVHLGVIAEMQHLMTWLGSPTAPARRCLVEGPHIFRSVGQMDAHRSTAALGSGATFQGLAKRGSGKDTVVLQALRWLGRTPESFVPGLPEGAGKKVPDDDSGRPALDTQAMHRALDEKRAAEGLSWAEVADQLGPGLSAAKLNRLNSGPGYLFPQAMRICQWLGRPVAEFTCFIPD